MQEKLYQIEQAKSIKAAGIRCLVNGSRKFVEAAIQVLDEGVPALIPILSAAVSGRA